MTHTEYDIYGDIVMTIQSFLRDNYLVGERDYRDDIIKPCFDVFRKQNPDLVGQLYESLNEIKPRIKKLSINSKVSLS